MLPLPLARIPSITHVVRRPNYGKRAFRTFQQEGAHVALTGELEFAFLAWDRIPINKRAWYWWTVAHERNLAILFYVKAFRESE